MSAVPAFATSDDDLQSLELFSGKVEDVITTARSPRPASKVAENVSVITSEQIEKLNAHTLAEVLNTIPGFQLQQVRTPGSVNFFFLDGASNFQIQLLIDDVPQNDLLGDTPDLDLIPVQHIDRVEIIKGAASAAWGQALGGVINVITKSPATDKAFSGSATASYGERFTTDTHAEATGTVDRLGYYLSGGFLHSDGLLPHNGINFRNIYGKIVYDLPSTGTITLGGDLRDAHNDMEEVPPPVDWHDQGTRRLFYYFINANLPLADHLTLQLLARHSRRDNETQYGFMSVPDQLFTEGKQRNSVRGYSGKLTWGDGQNNLTTGFEHEHAELSYESTSFFPDVARSSFSQSADRFAAYANGAITDHALTLLPGVRFDHTGTDGDLTSYTFGATYRVTDQTTIRGYWGRGFSLPRFFDSTGAQKVWTVQGGIESSDIPFLWLKGTYFYNNTWNINPIDSSPGATAQIRKGFELEARTVPYRNISLGTGYTLSDVRYHDSGAPVAGMPKHVAKVGLNYDNKESGLSGVLTGSFVKWTSIGDQNGKDRTFVWDLTFTKKLSPAENASELFVTGHNLFNNPQYTSEFFKNAGRWVEVGVRCRF